MYMMKHIYLLLLLLVLLTGCSFSQTVYEYVADNDSSNESGLEIIEEVEFDSELEEVDEIVEDTEIIEEIPFEPVVKIEDGDEISLVNVNKDFLGNSLYIFYSFTGQNLLEDPQDVRDWRVYIYVTKNDLVEMPHCYAEQVSSMEWIGTHCMLNNKFEEYNNIKIIYTNRSKGDLRNKSYRKLDNLDNVFVFDPVNL